MIDQLLAIWGSILGALAAVLLTVKASIPLVFGDAKNEFESINEKINSKLLRFSKGTGKVWGPGDDQFEHGTLPHSFKSINDRSSDNKQAGIYCPFDDHQNFWEDAREFINDGYYHVVGNELTNNIKNFEYDDFVSINSKIFDDIGGRSLSDPEKGCREFLDQFAALDFHRGLHQLYLEGKNQRKRTEWLENIKKVTGFFSVYSLILIMICIISSILLIHSKILWGYLLALISIFLFVCFVCSTFFMLDRLRLNCKVLIGTLLCTLLLFFGSFFLLRSCYFEPYILPHISDKSLNAFKDDTSDRALFLRILSIEWIKETLSQESNDASKDANSNCDGLNEKKDLPDGGTAKTKVIDDTLDMNIIKSNDKMPSDKAPLKTEDALNLEPLNKVKNKG